MAISWNGASWTPSIFYTLNNRVVNPPIVTVAPTQAPSVYRCTGSGISAGSGGPMGTSDAITDGTATWAYLGEFTGSVLDVASQLASGTPTITPAMQAVFLRLAETQIADPLVWGDLLDDGRRYYAAYLGELARLRGVGPVTSESVGPISQSNAALLGDSSLMLTTSGRMFLELVSGLPTIFGFTA